MKLGDWAAAHKKSPADVAEALASVKGLQNTPSQGTALKDEDRALLAEFFQIPSANETPLGAKLAAGNPETKARRAAAAHNEELLARKPKYTPKMFEVRSFSGTTESLRILAVDASEALRVFRLCHQNRDEYSSPNLQAIEIPLSAQAA